MTDNGNSERRDDPEQSGVVRYLAVLETLAASPQPLTLNEVAALVQTPRPTLHRMLQTLAHSGWISLGGKPIRYAVSLRVTSLGFRAARNHPIREVLLSAAVDLATVLATTVAIAFYEAGEVIFTDSIALRDGRAWPVLNGSRYPAPLSATGRVLLVYQPGPEVERVLARELPQLTERTQTVAQVRESLAVIRERGYDVADRELSLSSSGFAVPVFEGLNQVAGALCVIFPGPLRSETIQRMLQPAFEKAQLATAALQRGSDVHLAV